MGHERRHPERLVLRTSDEDTTSSTQATQTSSKTETRGAFFDLRMFEMNRLFDQVIKNLLFSF